MLDLECSLSSQARENHGVPVPLAILSQGRGKGRVEEAPGHVLQA